jgi:hypothetical protein
MHFVKNSALAVELDRPRFDATKKWMFPPEPLDTRRFAALSCIAQERLVLGFPTAWLTKPADDNRLRFPKRTRFKSSLVLVCLLRHSDGY